MKNHVIKLMKLLYKWKILKELQVRSRVLYVE